MSWNRPITGSLFGRMHILIDVRVLLSRRKIYPFFGWIGCSIATSCVRPVTVWSLINLHKHLPLQYQLAACKGSVELALVALWSKWYCVSVLSWGRWGDEKSFEDGKPCHEAEALTIRRLSEPGNKLITGILTITHSTVRFKSATSLLVLVFAYMISFSSLKINACCWAPDLLLLAKCHSGAPESHASNCSSSPKSGRICCCFTRQKRNKTSNIFNIGLASDRNEILK
jgi:hypothetical protein